MSKQDTCIFYEYFGDYGMSLCNHPNRSKDRTIYEDDCRKCKLHQTSSSGLKPCPFCGHKAHLSNFCGEFHVSCNRCEVEMRSEDISEVMNRWNKRKEGKTK